MQHTKLETHFTAFQQRTIIGCFITYTAAYIGRLNYAEALPAISASCGFTSAQLGIIQTAFAITYAAGQLIIGSLADRRKPLAFILTGLAGTAACNMCFSFARSYALMLLIWMLNGVSQSILWTPIMKLVSEWFDGPSRSRACFIMSAATIVGHLVSWILAAYLSTGFGWTAAFLVPGLLLLLVFLLTFAMLKNGSASPEADSPATASARCSMSLFYLLFNTGLSAILVTCVVNGFVRDGITTWAPTILSRVFEDRSTGSFFSLIIPFINIFGWGFSQLCFNKLKEGARPSIVVFMLTCSLVCAVTFFAQPMRAPVLACALGISCAIMYGNTPLLTAMLPMEYTSANRVALVAGLIDSFIYFGSALSGIILGHLGDNNQSAIYLLLFVFCMVGALFAAVSVKYKKNIR